MATIGSLNVKLTATTSAFSSGLASAARQASAFGQGIGGRFKSLASGALSFHGSLLGLASSLPVVGSLIAGLAGGTGLTTWIKESLDGVVATGRFADKVGMTTESVLAFRKVAAGVGIDAEASDHAMLRFSGELGKAARGSDEAAAKFRKLGLDPKSLALDKSDVQLQKVADAFQRLPEGMVRNGAASELLGHRMVGMANAFGQGSKAIIEAQDSLEKGGRSFSRGDAFNAEQADRSLKALEGTFKGLGIQLAVQLAPAIKVTADEMKGLFASGNLAAGVDTALGTIVATTGFVGDAFQLVEITVKSLELAFDKLALGFVKQVEVMLKIAGKLPDSLGGKGFRDAATGMDAMIGASVKKVSEMTGELAMLTQKPWAHNQAIEWFQNLKAKAKAAGDEFARLKVPPSPELLRLQELLDKVPGIIKENESPLEKWQTQMTDLNDMVRLGIIDWQTLGRAVMKANDELEKSAQIGDAKHASAMMEGSKEAAMTIMKARDQANKDDPITKLNASTERLKALQEINNRQQREMIDAIREGKVNEVRF